MTALSGRETRFPARSVLFVGFALWGGGALSCARARRRPARARVRPAAKSPLRGCLSLRPFVLPWFERFRTHSGAQAAACSRVGEFHETRRKRVAFSPVKEIEEYVRSLG